MTRPSDRSSGFNRCVERRRQEEPRSGRRNDGRPISPDRPCPTLAGPDGRGGGGRRRCFGSRVRRNASGLARALHRAGTGAGGARNCPGLPTPPRSGRGATPSPPRPGPSRRTTAPAIARARGRASRRPSWRHGARACPPGGARPGRTEERGPRCRSIGETERRPTGLRAAAQGWYDRPGLRRRERRGAARPRMRLACPSGGGGRGRRAVGRGSAWLDARDVRIATGSTSRSCPGRRH